ncbi:unnamed protein product [Paramecium primaurelia]|uniref:Uncharacterized protein n=1 Tax=Paramecium primaurelia TaxID=5886 RepID=A0A8S1LP02_PARPR|nr:unnamed protein product [Paramecium primaurelia]
MKSKRALIWIKKTAQEKQNVSEQMKMIDSNFESKVIENQPIKMNLLYYDILLNNGLVLKQSFLQPPEPHIYLMLNYYK